MTISTAISNSLTGIQNGMNRVAIAGSRIGFNGTDTSTLATSVVEQIEGKHQVDMSANVIKAANEMLGSIIDVRA